ncbi:MAG TPA: hypothetical protein VHD87_15215 [Acidimicrobiales bacterium]|nr:hypothetical protein [Acidimicrobiales bacterium]
MTGSRLLVVLAALNVVLWLAGYALRLRKWYWSRQRDAAQRRLDELTRDLAAFDMAP